MVDATTLSVSEVDAYLPQTQCARCGYPRCLEYAQAVATHTAHIDRCPPGGDITLHHLATLTGKTATELDPEVGTVMPRQIAIIDESACIGCVLCIKACPVDAIIGSNKLMHSIIRAECTGCELCLPVCPTDCISLQAISLQPQESPSLWPDYPEGFAEHARQRTELRLERLKNTAQKKTRPVTDTAHQDRQATILAAIERAQNKSD